MQFIAFHWIANDNEHCIIGVFVLLLVPSMEREGPQDQSSTVTLSGTCTIINILYVPNISREAETIGENL